MKKTLLVVLTGALLLIPVDAQAGNKKGPCINGNWQDRQHPGKVHAANMYILQCAIRKWPVSYDTAHYVAHRESGVYMWPWARNPSSGTCGIFQHMPQYWSGRVMSNIPAKWFGRERWTTSNMVRCTNARANILVSIHMAYKSGWGPWGY